MKCLFTNISCPIWRNSLFWAC